MGTVTFSLAAERAADRCPDQFYGVSKFKSNTGDTTWFNNCVALKPEIFSCHPGWTPWDHCNKNDFLDMFAAMYDSWGTVAMPELMGAPKEYTGTISAVTTVAPPSAPVDSTDRSPTALKTAVSEWRARRNAVIGCEPWNEPARQYWEADGDFYSTTSAPYDASDCSADYATCKQRTYQAKLVELSNLEVWYPAFAQCNNDYGPGEMSKHVLGTVSGFAGGSNVPYFDVLSWHSYNSYQTSDQSEANGFFYPTLDADRGGIKAFGDYCRSLLDSNSGTTKKQAITEGYPVGGPTTSMGAWGEVLRAIVAGQNIGNWKLRAILYFACNANDSDGMFQASSPYTPFPRYFALRDMVAPFFRGYKRILTPSAGAITVSCGNTPGSDQGNPVPRIQVVAGLNADGTELAILAANVDLSTNETMTFNLGVTPTGQITGVRTDTSQPRSSCLAFSPITASGTSFSKVIEKGSAYLFHVPLSAGPPPTPAPSVTGFTPTSGSSGTSVTITGLYFTGATAVKFYNNQSATFSVVSDTEITATVPAAAATGVISVTTPDGTGTSAGIFTILTGGNTSDLSDDFNDNSTDTGLWTDRVDAGTSVDEQNGHVEIGLATSGTPIAERQSVLTNYNLDIASIQVLNAGNQADNVAVWFQLNQNGDDGVYIGIKAQAGTLSAYQRDSLGVSTTFATATYNATTHAYWRFRYADIEAGIFVYFETSANGTDWTTLVSKALADVIAVTSVQVRFGAETVATVASPGTIIFDNVNVSAGTMRVGKVSSAAAARGVSLSIPSSNFPTTSVLDNFDRADGAPGANWTTAFGNSDALTISSNKITSAVAGFGGMAWNAAQFGPDVEVYATLSTLPGATKSVHLNARFTSLLATANGYYLKVVPSTGVWTFVRDDAGTPVNLGTASQAVSAGDSIGISIIGSTFTAYYKAAAGSWTAIGNYTDATYGAAGYAGLESADNTARADNFGGGTFSGTRTILPGKVSSPETVRGVDFSVSGSAPLEVWRVSSDSNVYGVGLQTGVGNVTLTVEVSIGGLTMTGKTTSSLTLTPKED